MVQERNVNRPVLLCIDTKVQNNTLANSIQQLYAYEYVETHNREGSISGHQDDLMLENLLMEMKEEKLFSSVDAEKPGATSY